MAKTPKKNYTNLDVRLKVYNKCKKAERLILHGIPWTRYAADRAYQYARFVLKHRWTEGERVILKCPQSAYLYARHVIGGRWEKAEKIIATSPSSSYQYAKRVLKGRFLLAEKCAKQTRTRWDEWDASRYAFYYARDIIKGCWKDGEKHIAAGGEVACLYAKNFLKARFKIAEDTIVYSAESAAEYAIFVLGKRWKKAEDNIIRNEKALTKYMDFLKGKDKIEMHNKILAEVIKRPSSYSAAKNWIQSHPDFSRDAC